MAEYSLEQRLDELRMKLAEVWNEKNGQLDNEILDISMQMDQLILEIIRTNGGDQ